MSKSALKKAGPFLGFYFSLAFPSLGLVQKYLGVGGIFLYGFSIFAAIYFINKYWLKNFLFRITGKSAYLIALITVIFLIISFFLLYPRINSAAPGTGSDRDEDVNIAVSELIGLRYPYYQATSLNNPISRFPGAIFLSIPFFLLGNQALQNFFWFFFFFVTAGKLLNDRRLAISLCLTVLFFCPVIMHEFLTGGDLIANTVYVLIFLFLFTNSACAPGAKEWKKILFAALFGISLSSRVNFILLIPLAFSFLAQNSGLRPALKYSAITVFMFLALTLPFYLYDPAHFSPLLWQFWIIERFNSVFTFSGTMVVILGWLIALALCFKSMKKDIFKLFIACMLVLFFPVLAGVILSSVKDGKLNLSMSGYGISFLFFGVLPFWQRLASAKK